MGSLSSLNIKTNMKSNFDIYIKIFPLLKDVPQLLTYNRIQSGIMYLSLPQGSPSPITLLLLFAQHYSEGILNYMLQGGFRGTVVREVQVLQIVEVAVK